MHVPPSGALGSHQAIVVAWGGNAWHLGIFFKVSRIQNLMVPGRNGGIGAGAGASIYQKKKRRIKKIKSNP